MKTSQQNKIEWVDSLKGIAICMVVFIHCGASNLDGILGKIGSVGGFGVTLFFVISGYLTSLSIDRTNRLSNGKVGGLNVHTLYWILKHFIRLLPLYWLALPLYVFISGGNQYFLGNQEHISFLNILTHIVFLHGLFPHYANSIMGVEWYLGVLAVFIVLSPFLWKHIDSIHKAVVWAIFGSFACSCICFSLSNMIPQTSESYLYVDYLGICCFVTHFPVLLISRVMYFVIKQKRIEHERRLMSYGMTFLFFWMAVGEILKKNELFGVGSYTLFALWFFVLIIGQEVKPNVLIINPLFSFIGRHSYTVYLFHYLFIYCGNKWLWGTGTEVHIIFAKYLTVLCLSLLLGITLEKYYEKPVITLLESKLKTIFE